MSAPVALSVVVPVYGCAQTIRPLHERLTRVLAPLFDNYELVFVDDRAEDGAWVILRQLAAEDSSVIACRLSRNVGQQLAITAGLAQCRGQHAVVMDCDLQDPPEAIPALLAKLKTGADIVYARRKSDHQPAYRKLANRAYFRFLEWATGQQFDGEIGSFSLISRRVIDAFLQFREQDRHYAMLLHEIGFESTVIEYARASRSIGTSSYDLWKLIGMAVSGVMFTTTRLLQWVIYLGLALAGTGLVWALVIVLLWMTRGALPGWTSLIVLQLLVGGVITLCIGVTGLYVGRIFEASRQRPLYFVQDVIDGPALARERAFKQKIASD
ncbi:MAG TPA: glycosyltransferase family 2 protein [Stellaceae bacterium]|nr:glycosyltransferase family 2 protein [Stellaceae bacterium]